MVFTISWLPVRWGVEISDVRVIAVCGDFLTSEAACVKISLDGEVEVLTKNSLSLCDPRLSSVNPGKYDIT